MNTVTFTAKTAKLFVNDYNKAAKNRDYTFVFDGNEYVVNYAYYLIQHLVNEKIINGSFDTDKQFTVKA